MMNRTLVRMGGENVLHFRDKGPFVVDGIAYQCFDGDPGVGVLRSMIEVFPDVDPFEFDYNGSTMCHSDPPTEDELDLYVKDRILPSL